MVPDDLLFASATKLLALLRAREIASTDLVDACLRRIEQVNPQLNAIVTSCAETARQEARQADRRLARGEARPLEGLPVTIKDTFEMAGVRSTAGTRIFEHHVPVSDAIAVDRLRAAGAIPLGKTNVPELALDFDCDNPVFGPTRNPWDPTRVPGGSSGGEAVAIATGCAPLGLGSDLGGSIRIPAHFCGIAGLKPTLEAIPRTGHMPAGIPPLPVALMGTVGPMARSVDDLALAFNLLRGPHPSDPYILPSPAAEPERVDVHGLGCAFYDDGGATPVTAPIRAAVRAAARALSDAGLRVEQQTPRGLDRVHELFLRFALTETRTAFRLLAGDRWHELRPQLRALLEQQPALTALEFLATGMERDVFRAELALFMQEFPIVLGPTLPMPAFPLGASEHEIEGVRVAHMVPLWATCWVNLAGVPAVVVPAGRTPEGLPIGVQIVGRPFAESQILAAAAVVERALGGYARPRST